MRVIAPYFEILDDLDQQSLAVRIEYSGRICYKSEDMIDQDSAIPFVRKMAEHGHNSVLEMGVLTVRVTYSEPQLLNELMATQPRYLHIDSLDNQVSKLSVRRTCKVQLQSQSLAARHAQNRVQLRP